MEKNKREKKYDLLSLGEVMLRFSPMDNDRLVRGETMKRQLAGAELNVLCGASLLGMKTGVITVLPDHAIGGFAKHTAQALGVSTEYVKEDTSKDARLGIYYYENGASPRKPGVVYDRKNSSINHISIDDFLEKMYYNTRCFHTSGITLALSENCRETAIEMMKRFKEAGALISFDVNFRGNLWSGEEARECIEKILPLVDIFFCSESTAQLTFKKEGDVQQILKSFAEEYPMKVVAATQRTVYSPKRHKFGSVVYDAENHCFYQEEAYDDIEIVDRIGSGDAYISGALYGFLSESGNCERMMQYGNAYSALKNTVPGDLPASDRKETEQVIREHHSTGPILEMNR